LSSFDRKEPPHAILERGFVISKLAFRGLYKNL
jgi:hypothetical protein